MRRCHRYISEAHASDEWPLGSREVVKQHKTLKERLAAARSFAERYKWTLPLVVDNMDNDFATTYGAWPERFLIAHGRTSVLFGQPTTEFGYDRSDIEEHLRAHVGVAGGQGTPAGEAGEERKTADAAAARAKREAPRGGSTKCGGEAAPRTAASLARVDAIMAAAPAWTVKPPKEAGGEEQPAA